MTFIHYDYLSNEILSIIMLILLALLISINKTISKQIENSYYITIFSTIIVILAEIVCSIFCNMQGKEYIIFTYISNIIGFTLSPVIPIFMSFIFDLRISKKLKILLEIPTLLNAVLVLLSPFGEYIFTVSSENLYSRGPLFFIFVITYTWNYLILITAIYKSSVDADKHDKRFLFSLILFTLVGTSVQVIFPDIHLTWHCVSIVLVLYYIFLCELRFKYDVTTGVFNRPTFDRALTDYERLKNCIIVMLDIDRFKEINDKYGHQHGDYCLNKIASVIKKCFNKTGVCYRYGGDEFCIICKTIDTHIIEGCLTQVMEQILVLRETDDTIPLVSYGYSVYDKKSEENINEVVKQADEKMYSHKEMRNTIV